MATISGSRFTNADKPELYLEAWHKFKSIAIRIKNWELELEEEEVEALLSIDPSLRTTIRSLSLSTRNYGGFPIIESELSQFPRLLSTLPNLTSPSISQAVTLSNGEIYPTGPSPSAVSTSYPFASTLKSFTFRQNDEDAPVGHTLLQFLAPFQFLQHLSITAGTFDYQSGVKITLPHLTSLELVGSQPGELDQILHHIKRPKLQVVSLEFPSLHHDEDFDEANIDNLYLALERHKSTLRHIYLAREQPLSRRAISRLSEAYRPGPRTWKFQPDVHSPWQPGEAEAAVHAEVPRSIVGSDLKIGMAEGGEKLAVWVLAELGRADKRWDLTRLRQLTAALKEVWELKQFLEE